MRTSAKALLVVLSSFLAVATAASTSSPAEAAESVDECVRLASVPVSSGISLEVDNHCDRSLACRLSWTVTCESASGKVVRTKSGAAQLTLASSATGKALASTSECADGWRVDDVRWACNPVK